MSAAGQSTSYAFGGPDVPDGADEDGVFRQAQRLRIEWSWRGEMVVSPHWNDYTAGVPMQLGAQFSRSLSDTKTMRQRAPPNDRCFQGCQAPPGAMSLCMEKTNRPGSRISPVRLAYTADRDGAG